MYINIYVYVNVSSYHLTPPHNPLHQSPTPQGQIKEGVFSFYLGADSPGELVIGGVDHDRYDGELHYMPLKVRCHVYL